MPPSPVQPQTTCSYFHHPKKAHFLPFHILKALAALPTLRFPKPQAILIDYFVYTLPKKMSCYIKLALTKVISIIYAWHIVKIPILVNFTSMETCMLVICVCPLSQNQYPNLSEEIL